MTVDLLAVEIEEEARTAGPEVSSEWIGRAVLERLRVLDPVSYLRFASVYKGFEGIADFEREFVELQKTTAPKRRGRALTRGSGARRFVKPVTSANLREPRETQA